MKARFFVDVGQHRKKFDRKISVESKNFFFLFCAHQMPWWVQLPSNEWKPGFIDRVEVRGDEYVLYLKPKTEAPYAIVCQRQGNKIRVPDDVDVEILIMSGAMLDTYDRDRVGLCTGYLSSN